MKTPYPTHLQAIADKTGKPVEWHIARAIKAYLVRHGMFSPKERLLPDRSDCVVPCTEIAGGEKCGGCNNYLSEKDYTPQPCLTADRGTTKSRVPSSVERPAATQHI